MLKISAAISIILLSFNWFGYRLLVNYLQHKSDICLQEKLDENKYDESRLIEIKIPLNLPYHDANTDYERFDGGLEYNGTYYNYVKRKVANDTLYIKCIDNLNKTKLETAKNDFYKNTNDLSKDNKKSDNSKTGIFKIISGDYDNCMMLLTANHTFAENIISTSSHYSGQLASRPTLTPERPPEVVVF